ncbi:MAG: ribose 5-phosphate isomerase B [Actinomycetota bacterium]
MRIAIGADHAGYPLKAHLVTYLEGQGHEVADVGTSSTEAVDYPPYCAAVGRRVADGRADLGIVTGGSGQGEQLAANKVRGVRAALCNDLYTARMAREHNDANVLSLGARIVATGLAEEIVDLFVATPFAGGRHERRVDQVMALEGFDLHEALYTTRAMRRVSSEPIPNDVVGRIIDAAVRAPSGGNQQRFRFLTVTSATTKAQLAEWYAEDLAELNRTRYADVQASIESGDPNDPEITQAKMNSGSAIWLAEHLAEVPLLLFVFGREGGESSTFPALWNACLAARAEGVGSTITTLLRGHRAEVEDLLGVPDDGEWIMHAMIPMGYPLGRWGVAERRPAHESTYSERWGASPDWQVDQPLWPAPHPTG